MEAHQEACLHQSNAAGESFRTTPKFQFQTADKQSVGVCTEAPSAAPPLYGAIGRIRPKHEWKIGSRFRTSRMDDTQFASLQSRECAGEVVSLTCDFA